MTMENEVRLIDANALVRFIDPGHLRSKFELCFSEDSVVSMIRNAPTIDPESLRPKGRWGVHRESEISKTVYCTNCWQEFYIHRKGEVQIDTQPYCPNCGAKMEG